MSPDWTYLVGAAALSALIAWGAIALLLQSTITRHFADQPNNRSLHHQPVPRIGGMAIVASIGLSMVLFAVMASDGLPGEAPVANPGAAASSAPAIVVLLAGMLVLCIVGVIDDLSDLSPLARACVQLCCAVALSASWLFSHGSPDGMSPAGGWTLALPLLWIGLLGWSANLFNFMDGSDGIAGAMAVTGFGAMAWVAPHGSATALLATVAAGASAGFLLFNWHPARVFMGDAGSVPLGFLAAGLGIHGTTVDYWPFWFPIACFLPFLFDATLTLILRLAVGHRPWQAHREHAYQRLILAGWSHRSVALGYFGLGVVCGVVGATIRYQNGYVFFIAWTVIILVHAGLFWRARRSAR